MRFISCPFFAPQKGVMESFSTFFMERSKALVTWCHRQRCGSDKREKIPKNYTCVYWTCISKLMINAFNFSRFLTSSFWCCIDSAMAVTFWVSVGRGTWTRKSQRTQKSSLPASLSVTWSTPASSCSHTYLERLSISVNFRIQSWMWSELFYGLELLEQHFITGTDINRPTTLQVWHPKGWWVMLCYAPKKIV